MSFKRGQTISRNVKVSESCSFAGREPESRLQHHPEDPGNVLHDEQEAAGEDVRHAREVVKE